MIDIKKKPGGENLPSIDDEGVQPPVFTEQELDEIWVGAGNQLPRPKE